MLNTCHNLTFSQSEKAKAILAKPIISFWVGNNTRYQYMSHHQWVTDPPLQSCSLLQHCHYTTPSLQTLNSTHTASFFCHNYSKFLWSIKWLSTKKKSPPGLLCLWKYVIKMTLSLTSLLNLLIRYNLSTAWIRLLFCRSFFIFLQQ